MNTGILWENKSTVAVLVAKSKNIKTGNLPQVFLLRKDIHPVEAIKTGKDEAVCGNCPLRGKNGKGRACYVVVGFSVSQIYKAYKRGSYKKININDISGDAIRLTAYGDPAFIPQKLIKKLLTRFNKVLAYSHQWRNPRKQFHKQYAMASVESLKDKTKANKMGWRTFRIVKSVEDLQGDEILCPASKEMGHKITCEKCGICNGNYTGRKKNVAIVGHGSPLSAGRNVMEYVS